MLEFWNRFRHDRRGNIGLIFAILVLPLVTFVGVAIDYSLANATYSKLMACADTAVLAAVNPTGVADPPTVAETKMKTTFQQLCGPTDPKLARVTINSVTATVTDANSTRSATLNFNAQQPNNLMQLAGFPNSGIKGSSKSSSAQPTNIDIYALLDNSPSMGLAATTADQAKMRSLTPDQCEFACHVVGATNDYWKIAKTNNVTMRIDVLRDSWINMISNAQKSTNANQFRFATYVFNSTLTQQQGLTGSYATAQSAAQSIDLVAVPSGGPGSTYTDNALGLIAPLIPASGDGTSAAQSKKYMILVTDGVQDFFSPSALYGHQTQVVSSNMCDALKAKGIQVAVIYTSYLAMTEQTYIGLVKPFANNIAPALQACATSSDLFFQADQASDIQNAFDNIFARILKSARLTQ